MLPHHPKRDYLAAAGALHPHPEEVRADIFLRNRFFDPLDKIQVKYEMLRAHAVDGQNVASVAAAFGFSRETFYQTWRSFEESGTAGLRDEKRGRRGPVKLTEELVDWVRRSAVEHPEWSGAMMAKRLEEAKGVLLHRRTVQRLLAGVKKNS
jgi:transposase